MAENKLGYRIARKGSLNNQKSNRYTLREISPMTTHQLREICRKEKIINGVMDNLSKEELIRTIIRYRGSVEDKLIRSESPEGRERLAEVIKGAKITDIDNIGGGSVTVYNNCGVNLYDNITLTYDAHYINTNALVISAQEKNVEICGIFNICAKSNDKSKMYLTKSREISCQEGGNRNYYLCVMDKESSEYLYDLYEGNVREVLSSRIKIGRMPLLNFIIKDPVVMPLPLVVDFGYQGVAVGTYLSSSFFEAQSVDDNENKNWKKDSVNFVSFYNNLFSSSDMQKTVPCTIGLRSVDDEGNPDFMFGYEAVAEQFLNYADDSFFINFDIKVWLYNPDEEEAFVDRFGKRHLISRWTALRAFFNYILSETQDYFKCEVKNLYFTASIKEKALYVDFFSKLLPQFNISDEHIIYENVGILYNVIMNLVKRKKIRMKERYSALTIDCGASRTTGVSSEFSVQNKSMAFYINIDDTFINGKLGYGGMNLTYKIMQYLKLRICQNCGDEAIRKKISLLLLELSEFETIDVYREIDENGESAVYSSFDKMYEEAEKVLPTKFKQWENVGRSDYYRVKNNFFNLFMLAEQVKNTLYGQYNSPLFTISEDASKSEIVVDRWKYNMYNGKEFYVMKSFPEIQINRINIDLLLKGPIYNSVKYCMNDLYNSGKIDDYSICKLAGQSTRIPIYKEAVSEFMAGMRIQGNSIVVKKEGYSKNSGIDGVIRYLYNKYYGFTELNYTLDYKRLPYNVVAYSHDGREIILMDGKKWKNEVHYVSRSMDELTLSMLLRDQDGDIKCEYNLLCKMDEFEKKTYEEISEIYGDIIEQDDIDTIVNNETRFFVWAVPEKWGFNVVPVYRENEELYLGACRMFYFENEKWVPRIMSGTY